MNPVPSPARDELDDLQDLDEPIVQRADGWYWQDIDTRVEVGPFDSAAAARADWQAAGEDAPEPGESLAEAESELGISDWIDPDTGSPAEGLGPRLGDE